MIASELVNGDFLDLDLNYYEPDFNYSDVDLREIEPDQLSDENGPDIAPDDQVVIEDFKLESSREPFEFRIGEEDFKIQFDLRIDYGKSSNLKIVTVDCEPNLVYHSIFRSELLSRFTNNTGTKLMASICWRKNVHSRVHDSTANISRLNIYNACPF